MPIPEIARPGPDEYAPYFSQYIDLVPEGHIVPFLEAQLSERHALYQGLTEEQGNHCYEPGKWSLKQVLGHVTDTERIFHYRALCAARGDSTPLPGFDQDVYVRGAGFEQRSLADVLDEFDNVRKETVRLFRRFSPAQLTRRGIADSKPFSVRMIPFLLAGHEAHHRKVIEERYLTA